MTHPCGQELKSALDSDGIGFYQCRCLALEQLSVDPVGFPLGCEISQTFHFWDDLGYSSQVLCRTFSDGLHLPRLWLTQSDGLLGRGPKSSHLLLVLSHQGCTSLMVDLCASQALSWQMPPLSAPLPSGP